MQSLLTTALLAAQNGQDGAAGFTFFIPMILILVLFFWMSHRSQKKKEQERQEMIDSIQAKDDVITIGGIHGRVMEVGKDTFDLRIDTDKNIRITINKSAVARKAGEVEEGA